MMRTSVKGLVESLGPMGFYEKLCTLLNEKAIGVDEISYRELADACGVLGDMGKLRGWSGETQVPARLLSESNPGVGTNLFQVVTGELLGRKVLEGYEDSSGFIGDELVTVLSSTMRGSKLAGFRALSGPTEVAESHPYEETSFEEKFVTTREAKQGRILSINEELIAFDQTGEINRRAMALGYYLRQERERAIVRAVTDADAANRVYRPNGVGQALYAANGSNRNWVGAGNTTSPDHATAIPLEDWTDIDEVLNYRATQVVDDRVDGDPRPILAVAKQILVPERLRGTALSIANSTEVTMTSGGSETRAANPLLGRFQVLSSPFIDEQGGQAVHDWYIGDFRRQFVWTEIWPVQTFLQRAESEAAFERDVVLRVKARYFGGVSAVDTLFVTKVDGQ